MSYAPRPIVEVALEPKTEADRERLRTALAELTAEDRTLMASTHRESGLTILIGAGKSHLDAAIGILKRTYKVDAEIAAPRVAYRERLKKRAEIDYTHQKRMGGGSQFARVTIEIAPDEPGAGYWFSSKIAESAMPEQFVSGIKKGIRSAMDSGILAGFPVVDTRATLVYSAFHDVDSSALAFEIAARAATREGLRKGGSELLEPMMKVEVQTSKEHADRVVADLNSRGAQSERQDLPGRAIAIRAVVPLANMFGYASQLRSLTRGSASHTMQFSHYAPIPPPDNGPSRPAMAARA